MNSTKTRYARRMTDAWAIFDRETGEVFAIATSRKIAESIRNAQFDSDAYYYPRKVNASLTHKWSN